ncbi:MAG: hypothetical protein IS632_01145 [Thaumarchaeota archaeon]|nr:hypothetical protein [Nitrososphaerota archaeon]
MLELQFHDNLAAGSYIALAGHLRMRYRNMGILADNAGVLTGCTMRKYLADADGNVEILYLPPRTHISTP